MKIIIAGGRSYIPNTRHEDIIIDILVNNNCTEVVSGGCRGADKFGENISNELRIPVKIFKANWALQGPMAGPIRNRSMAAYADGCILLPGGKGTANMKKMAEEFFFKNMGD